MYCKGAIQDKFNGVAIDRTCPIYILCCHYCKYKEACNPPCHPSDCNSLISKKDVKLMALKIFLKKD